MDFRTEVVQQLSEFYLSKGIDKAGFCCKHHHSICERIAAERGIRFGTEAHVGHLYGSGSTRRIVVVSLDAGAYGGEDIEERTRNLESAKNIDLALTDHIKGTYLFLSLLLRDQIGEISPMPHIVQINSSQCTPRHGGSGQFPKKIHDQCLPFKERELEIAVRRSCGCRALIHGTIFGRNYEHSTTR